MITNDVNNSNVYTFYRSFRIAVRRVVANLLRRGIDEQPVGKREGQGQDHGYVLQVLF